MTNEEFVKSLAVYIRKYAKQYGILVYSPIIAQGILESGWGRSRLSSQYHNYFGLKCGTKWKGPSVNMATQEEFTPGTLTNIRDNFRVYKNMEEGVKGYFEFIQLPRYHNLRGITDPRTYLETIKSDGYATSSDYVENLMKVIKQYYLTQYDEKGDNDMMTEYELRLMPVNWMKQFIGISEGSTEHRNILAVFNDSKLCTRYVMTVRDAWCATGCCSSMIATNLVDIFPCVECSVGNMVAMAQKAGIWIEDDAFRPKVGDHIVYRWSDNGVGDCKGWPDHIGIVAEVNGNYMRIIECNFNNTVGYRSIAVNGKFIRGYITPNYASKATSRPTIPSAPVPNKGLREVALEVISGQWGNGDLRKENLKAAGYDPEEVQKEVNRILSSQPSKPSKSVDIVAREIIAGKWGNGSDRVKRLQSAGYDPEEVQRKVNTLLKPSKSTDTIAREVLAGLWGNGKERVDRLKAAGYNPDSIQKRVNQLYK